MGDPSGCGRVSSGARISDAEDYIAKYQMNIALIGNKLQQTLFNFIGKPAESGKLSSVTNRCNLGALPGKRLQ